MSWADAKFAPRRTPWTVKRLEAVICAVTAMLAGEEGEGDGAHVTHEDLNAGLARLQDELARLKRGK